MMRRKDLLIILLLLVAITPYFILCFQALPYADDFCYAWESLKDISFAERFMDQYMHWSGRYSAHVLLCNHPLTRGLIWYHVGDFVAMAFTLLSVFLFFRVVLEQLWIALTVTLMAFLFYLCYMPQLSDGVYWYTGVCNYELSSAFFLLHLSLFILWTRKRVVAGTMLLLISAVSLIISIGFNELGAALIPAYYLLALLLLYRVGVERGIFRMAVVFFGIAFISSAVLVFAPGNLVHSHPYHENFHILHSVLFASLQTGRYTLTWLSTIPSLLLSLFVMARADRVPDTALFRFDHRFILLLLLFTVFMSAFMPYLTTGIMGQHRTINYAFFFFILLWAWWLISFSKRYSLYKLPGIALAGSIRYGIIILSMTVMMISANGGGIVRDLWHGNFAAYKMDFVRRHEELQHNPGISVRPLKVIPETFNITDARTDTSWFVNRCIKIYTLKTPKLTPQSIN